MSFQHISFHFYLSSICSPGISSNPTIFFLIKKNSKHLFVFVFFYLYVNWGCHEILCFLFHTIPSLEEMNYREIYLHCSLTLSSLVCVLLF